jgi:endonuclease YncB( thermonuclease family)
MFRAPISLLALLALALVQSAYAANPPRCPEDGDGGACVWGRAEGWDGGGVQVRGLRINFIGITAPSRKDLCADKREEFDCARPARKKVAELVAKGPVACEIMDVASGELRGKCRSEAGDMGRILVEAGLARAAKEGPYDDAQGVAITKKLGLWAPDIVLPRDWDRVRSKGQD